MTDWTTILTTVGASAVTGLAAWYGTRKSADIGVRQIEAENTRLREQHREEHLRNRQETYHQFLTADDRIRALVATPVGTDEEAAAFLAAYPVWRDVANGVLLFGDDNVVAVTERLLQKFRELVANIGDSDETRLAVYDAFEPHLRSLREELLTAMRADVGPRGPGGDPNALTR